MFNTWRIDTLYLSWPMAAAIWLAAALLVVALGARSMTGFDPLRKWTAIGLRLDLLLFVVLLLAGAQATRRVTDLSVVAVRDVSDSAALATPPVGASRFAVDFVRERVADRPPADRVGLVSFGAEPRVDAMPEPRTPDLAAAAARTSRAAAGTDVAQAIQLALATLPGDTLGRLLLFWDGNATGGDLDAALAAAASRGVPVDVVPIRYRVRREVAVDRLVAPTVRDEREPYSLDVVLRSENPGPTTARLVVLDNGEPVDLDPARPGVQRERVVTLRPGANVEHVAIAPSAGGAHRYRAFVEGVAATDDTIAANNVADAVTLVRGRGRVLYVGRGSAAEPPIVAALRGGGVDVAVEGRDAVFPSTLAELQAYDAVVLDNVARGGVGGVSGAQDAMLERYVRDLGGGLLVVGGPDALGAGGWIGSAVERVLPVDLNPPAIRAIPSGALVLVIDRSGSMERPMPGGGGAGSKLETAVRAAGLSLRTLLPSDAVGVIGFDDVVSWAVPLRPNDSPAAAERAMGTLRPRGGTNIAPALAEAVDAIERLPADKPYSVKHVLLLTDGLSTGGDYEAVLRRMKARGITLSTVGIGDDVDAPLLARLASDGEGRFYPIADAARLTQVFVKEAVTLRRTLIQEAEFTPRVAAPDHPILAGLDGGWPTFRGLVLTWPKPSPTVTVALASGSGDPLLATWTAGLGRSAVFTSDDGARWAGAFARSSTYDKFWQQATRAIARPAMSRGAIARIESAGTGRARIVVDADAADGRAGPMVASVLAPDSDRATSVRLEQTGPGVFEGAFAAPADGAYVATVRWGAEGAWVPASFVRDGGAELRALASDDAAIARVAARTGGRVLEPTDRLASLFSRDNVGPRDASLPLTPWLIVASIATLIADVAVRRIAWDRAAIAGLFVRHGPVARPESTESIARRMAALRDARGAAAERFADAAERPTAGVDKRKAMDALLKRPRRPD